MAATPDAPIALLEYGSYACPYCRAAHERIITLRDDFGDRMRHAADAAGGVGGRQPGQGRRRRQMGVGVDEQVSDVHTVAVLGPTLYQGRRLVGRAP